eukprot:CAMPEP_0119365672 /NCGR_PEP_ID=MMETSP1334-20130426/12588_1 /TAXON_ID=127549 /ORGANISM="Calcidiscus leptoporus, Strain RCC1130" /LENGTH=354 /DNA_ID=CAMNT_0007381705 /DNA_START=132 /DNA_END=1196 /DNA_ORIENTATION=+
MCVSRCTETWRFDREALELPAEARRTLVNSQVKEAVGSFAPGALAGSAPISLIEESAVIGAFLVVMGGPLALLASGMWIALFGTWIALGGWLVLSLALAYHPLPHCADELRASWFVRALYKYFSYRFVWSGDDDKLSQQSKPWFGAGPPHGVLPLANLLSIPAINSFGFVHFVGAPASVVFHTPFLRYMTMLGCVDVSGASMAKAVAAGTCVGIVPDGIAGIFKCKEEDEVVFLKSRKGLAKLALRTGTPILPAYSVGNTAVFGAWFDPFGIMEALSRKAQTSLFLYWGRFGLPIPRRVNITMLFGAPISVEHIEHPSQQQVDELHEKYLQAIQQLFDKHRAALGWNHKTLRVV